jgi:hypothetical protein
MPINIEELTSEVTVVEGDLPLTPAQVDTLARLVMKRIEDKHRSAAQLRTATVIRRDVAPASAVGE